MTSKQPQAIREETDPTRSVRAAQCGDRQAFGELVTRYQGAVYAIAFRRLGSHAEAQELCQEVFIQALRKIDQLRDPRCFGGWLRAIANRMAINRAMRRGPLVPTSPFGGARGAYPSDGRAALEATCVEHETPLRTVLTRERENQVHLGLGRLRTMDRETLVAFYFDGRTLLEMSQAFDSPVGTIKRRLHVARKRLARELGALATV